MQLSLITMYMHNMSVTDMNILNKNKGFKLLVYGEVGFDAGEEVDLPCLLRCCNRENSLYYTA
jgi:hypothetical protein